MTFSSAPHVVRVVLGGVVACLAIWLLAVAALRLEEPRLVFRTDLSRAYTAPLDHGLFREGAIAVDGLRLDTVTLAHDDERDRYWILFCPSAGASTRVQRIQQQLRTLRELGYNIFAFDYRGFGRNAGTPTEAGLYADALAAYHYMIDVLHVPADRIILAGRSLGAAVAVDLAARIDAAGLLLLAPIDSVPSAGQRAFPWAPVRLLARHQFDAASKAGRIDVPVVAAYGFPDRYMRLADVRALLRAFRGPKLLLETGGGHHHAGFTDVPLLYRALRQFWPVT